MYGGGYEAWTVKALELLLLAELARQETTPQKE
jgi:hypothetical protein